MVAANQRPREEHRCIPVRVRDARSCLAASRHRRFIRVVIAGMVSPIGMNPPGTGTSRSCGAEFVARAAKLSTSGREASATCSRRRFYLLIHAAIVGPSEEASARCSRRCAYSRMSHVEVAARDPARSIRDALAAALAESDDRSAANGASARWSRQRCGVPRLSASAVNGASATRWR